MHVSEIQMLLSTAVDPIRPCPEYHEDPKALPETDKYRLCSYLATLAIDEEETFGVSNEITSVKLAAVLPAVSMTARLVRYPKDD